MKFNLTNYLSLICLIYFFSTCSTGVTPTSTVTPTGDSVVFVEKQETNLKIKKLNDIAQFIAGMPVDSASELYDLSLTEEWKAYSNESEKAFEKFKKVSDLASVWRNQELPQAEESFQTLFYPFGGPDFLFANVFFPKANNYIMIGLEDPGTVPQINAFNKKDLKQILTLYKTSIEDVIQLSFFRTVDMNVELKTNAIDGTVPIMMLFLARSGKELLDIEPLMLNDSGKLVSSNKNKHTAIGINFRNPGDTVVRHIYYLSTNLADPALNENKNFKKFLENIDDHALTFVKSATYLMHKSYFSIIRNTVLTKSSIILQDDSGIAYKFFDKKKWNISLYGTYEKPISLFKDFYEPDLFEAYQKKSKPLNYRIGYNTKSHLLIAQKMK